MATSTAAYAPFRTKDYLSLAEQFPPNVPIVVVHFLRFHPVAQYPPNSPFASLEPISGRDAFYKRYAPAGTAAARELGVAPGESRFFSSSVTPLLADRNNVPWDIVTARKFSNFGDYAKYQASEAYQTRAVPHRDAALMDWSLVACIEEEPPKF